MCYYIIFLWVLHIGWYAPLQYFMMEGNWRFFPGGIYIYNKKENIMEIWERGYNKVDGKKREWSTKKVSFLIDQFGSILNTQQQ